MDERTTLTDADITTGDRIDEVRGEVGDADMDDQDGDTDDTDADADDTDA